MRCLARLYCITAALLLALLPPLPAAAEDGGGLRVLLNHAPPYRIVSRDHGVPRHSGIYVDIAEAAAKRAGLKLAFIEVPYARAFAMMENGEGDMMLGPNRTAERERYLLYLEPALPAEPKAFVIRRNGGPAIADHAALRGLRIAILRGARHSARFDGDGALDRIPVVSYEEALRMLQGGRVDTAIMPELRARWLLRGQIGLNLAAHQEPGEPSHIVLSRRGNGRDAAAALSLALRQMQQAGEIARILALYS